MIVQLFIGPLVDKFGHKPLAVLGFAVTSLSMFLLAFASSFALAMVASILLGVGAMCVNTVGNTLIPVVLFEGKDPARASNFGNAFFGLGLVVTPLIPFLVINKMGYGYSTVLVIIGILSALFLIFALTTTFPKVSTGYKFSMAVKLLGKGAVLIAALALICYISLESTMNTWIKPLMTEVFKAKGNVNAVANASLVLSLFGVAMMVGRFITSAVKNLTAIGTKVIMVASIVSILAVILMIKSTSPAMVILAVIITGLAFAPIFPTIVGVTFAKFDSSLYGSIFGIIFAVGLLGGTFVPKIIGNLSETGGIQSGLTIAAVMAAILFVIGFFMGKVGKAEE